MADPTADRPAADVVVSYLTLRRVVGVLGMALPVVLAVWGFVLQRRVAVLSSLSDYYQLRTRDALVGILFTIAWFLYTYRGYSRTDDVAGNGACVCALGVALSPASGSPLEHAMHYACAAGLFLILAFFSLFLFTKTGGSPTRAKLARNRVYRVCGVVMLASIGAIAAVQAFAPGSPAPAVPPVFALETIALWAFGVSWFIKGETLLKD